MPETIYSAGKTPLIYIENCLYMFLYKHPLIYWQTLLGCQSLTEQKRFYYQEWPPYLEPLF